MGTGIEKNEGGQKEAEEALPPIEPMVLVRRLLRQFRTIPWLGLSAIGTGLGVLLLVGYFKSIGFVPPDVTAILGASVFVAMLAVAFVALVVMSIVAPTWAYKDQRLSHVTASQDEHVPFRDRLGLPALQLVGVGALFLCLAALEWMRCSSYVYAYLLIGAVLVAIGLVIWIRLEIRLLAAPRAWRKRSISAVWVAAMSVPPLGGLMALLIPGQDIEWTHLIAMVVVWGLVVWSSAFLDRVSVLASASAVCVLFPILAFSLPAMVGDISLFVRQIAEVTGIRLARPADMHMPVATCRLIEGALGSAEPAQPMNCDHPEWGAAHAQVLSNLGNRWLIDVPLRGGAQSGSLRLTIPADGVQIVYRSPPSRSSCRTF